MQTILTVNGGSSSLKCELFETDRTMLKPLYRFKLGNILGEARFSVLDHNDEVIEKSTLSFDDIPKNERHTACLSTILNWLKAHCANSTLIAIGHRVVHGGNHFFTPCVVEAPQIESLKTLIPLAPLHQPYNIKLIEACHSLAPDLPQIACFDTMFHASQSTLEQHYAIPRKYTDEGIHRYGFHGLSYEFIQRQLTKLNPSPINTIVCHLGAGASMCAIKEGKSIASSMGFTAVDGLPMGSRCGNIDPGVLLYLQRHHGMSADDLEKLIYKESGWLGVSGISSDMLTLHQSDDPHAAEAIEMFSYRAALEIGRLAAALEGLEQIVFTGGVGENDAITRHKILSRCQWLGATFDEAANTSAADVISTANAKVQVRVIPTNEEEMIATHVLEVMEDIHAT